LSKLNVHAFPLRYPIISNWLLTSSETNPVMADSQKTGSGSNDNQDPEAYNPDTFKVLLKKLVQSPTEFQPEDCALSFRHLCVQAASDAQVCLTSSNQLTERSAPS
jgi:hypothetical protein